MINVNQITSRLASMPDQALQQYAAMHKNDPYVMALALSESNRRKQMRQGAQMQAPQQPKVVDQEIAGMAQPMPEDTGIGQLPAPNMQSMAEGGIVAFEDGGSTSQYSDAFERAFAKVLKFEGKKYVPNDAGKGPTKFGINQTANPDVDVANLTLEDAKQIYKKRYWDKIGGDDIATTNPQLATIAFDAAVNQGVRPALNMLDKSGGEPNKLLALRQQRYIDLAANDPSKKQFLSGWTNRVASLQSDLKTDKDRLPMTVPSSTAQAAPGITALPPDVSSQIPGQTVKAPVPEPEDTSFLSPGSFQRGAEAVGLSKDVGRQAYNTLMAPTPLAPITTLPKVAGKSTGLAALGEKIYNKFVPAAGMSEKQVAALRAETEAAKAAEAGGQLLPRLTPPAPPVPAGGPALPVTPGGQAVVQSAADLEKVRLANQATDQLAASQAAARTATETAKLPSAAERLQQASYIRESDEAARLMNRARAATNTKTTGQTAVGAANAPPVETTGIQNLVPEEAAAPDLSKNAADDIVKMLKKDTGATTTELKQQAADSGMDWNSFLVRFGLGLMAGKSPDALQNIGEAGLSALDAQIAAQKAKQTEAGGLADIEYKQAATKKAVAEADFIANGAKEKNLALQAEQLIAQKVKDLPVTSRMDATQLALAENRIRQSVYQQLGIPLTMLTGAPAPAGGFSVVGSRPG
jgi:lysozyme family protein